MLPMTIFAIIQDSEQRQGVEQMFQRYYKRMYQAAFEILQHSMDAEDTVMSVFATIAEEPERFLEQKEEEIAALLYVVTKHRALDLYRKREATARHEMYSAEIANLKTSENALPLHFVINQETQAAVFEAIMELEMLLRAPILLKYYYQMSNREIARMLDINYNTLNTRLHRAKKEVEVSLVRRGVIER